MKRKKAYTIPRKDNDLSHIELEDKENKGVHCMSSGHLHTDRLVAGC